MKNALILGKVWPEPQSSAAGWRLLQIFAMLRSQGYDLHFASPASPGEFSFDPGEFNVTARVMPINDSLFDDYLKDLHPALVLFDRFTTEEQFGWRVKGICPAALRVLDTEDLHCLRLERQEAVKNSRPFETQALMESPVAFREMASIYRCDLSLIISRYECRLLEDVFKIPVPLFHYLPFLVETSALKQHRELPAFEDRKHFISLGNYLHAPNRDSVLYLKKEIWPLIRKKLPQAELHCYGAYPDHQINSLHDPVNGFIIKGRAGKTEELFLSARVCLAPLRFGAGLKGKLLEAAVNGCPSITTPIGAEGMSEGIKWPGVIGETPEELAEAAVRTYSDKAHWNAAASGAYSFVSEQFGLREHSAAFAEKLSDLQKDISTHRRNNFVGAMLQHHHLQSTRYMSLWIETKNRLKNV